MEMTDRPKWLKWLAVALAAIAIGHGAQLFFSMSNTVRTTYAAPARPLTVTIYDSDGERLRRTQFGQTGHQHELTLPSGSYSATLTPDGMKTVRRHFIVEGDATINLSYR